MTSQMPDFGVWPVPEHQGLLAPGFVWWFLQDSWGFSPPPQPCFIFFLWNPASHLHKTSATWLDAIQCHEDAVGSGDRLLSPSGTCLLASSFTRRSQVCQEPGGGRSLSPLPSFHLPVPLCERPAAEPGFSPSFSGKLSPPPGGARFLWSLGTPWCPSDALRLTSESLRGSLVIVQYERASIIHAHLFPSALLGETPARGM